MPLDNFTSISKFVKVISELDPNNLQTVSSMWLGMDLLEPGHDFLSNQVFTSEAFKDSTIFDATQIKNWQETLRGGKERPDNSKSKLFSGLLHQQNYMDLSDNQHLIQAVDCFLQSHQLQSDLTSFEATRAEAESQVASAATPAPSVIPAKAGIQEAQTLPPFALFQLGLLLIRESKNFSNKKELQELLKDIIKSLSLESSTEPDNIDLAVLGYQILHLAAQQDHPFAQIYLGRKLIKSKQSADKAQSIAYLVTAHKLLRNRYDPGKKTNTAARVEKRLQELVKELFDELKSIKENPVTRFARWLIWDGKPPAGEGAVSGLNANIDDELTKMFSRFKSANDSICCVSGLIVVARQFASTQSRDKNLEIYKYLLNFIFNNQFALLRHPLMIVECDRVIALLEEQDQTNYSHQLLEAINKAYLVKDSPKKEQKKQGIHKKAYARTTRRGKQSLGVQRELAQSAGNVYAQSFSAVIQERQIEYSEDAKKLAAKRIAFFRLLQKQLDQIVDGLLSKAKSSYPKVFEKRNFVGREALAQATSEKSAQEEVLARNLRELTLETLHVLEGDADIINSINEFIRNGLFFDSSIIKATLASKLTDVMLSQASNFLREAVADVIIHHAVLDDGALSDDENIEKAVKSTRRALIEMLKDLSQVKDVSAIRRDARVSMRREFGLSKEKKKKSDDEARYQRVKGTVDQALSSAIEVLGLASFAPGKVKGVKKLRRKGDESKVKLQTSEGRKVEFVENDFSTIFVSILSKILDNIVFQFKSVEDRKPQKSSPITLNADDLREIWELADSEERFAADRSMSWLRQFISTGRHPAEKFLGFVVEFAKKLSDSKFPNRDMWRKNIMTFFAHNVDQLNSVAIVRPLAALIFLGKAHDDVDIEEIINFFRLFGKRFQMPENSEDLQFLEQLVNTAWLHSLAKDIAGNHSLVKERFELLFKKERKNFVQLEEESEALRERMGVFSVNINRESRYVAILKEEEFPDNVVISASEEKLQSATKNLHGIKEKYKAKQDEIESKKQSLLSQAIDGVLPDAVKKTLAERCQAYLTSLDEKLFQEIYKTTVNVDKMEGEHSLLTQTIFGLIREQYAFAGMSGSFNFKTTWNSLPSFQKLAYFKKACLLLDDYALSELQAPILERSNLRFEFYFDHQFPLSFNMTSIAIAKLFLEQHQNSNPFNTWLLATLLLQQIEVADRQYEKPVLVETRVFREMEALADQLKDELSQHIPPVCVRKKESTAVVFAQSSEAQSEYLNVSGEAEAPSDSDSESEEIVETPLSWLQGARNVVAASMAQEGDLLARLLDFETVDDNSGEVIGLATAKQILPKNFKDRLANPIIANRLLTELISMIKPHANDPNFHQNVLAILAVALDNVCEWCLGSNKMQKPPLETIVAELRSLLQEAKIYPQEEVENQPALDKRSFGGQSHLYKVDFPPRKNPFTAHMTVAPPAGASNS